jgi:hypothetical protein
MKRLLLALTALLACGALAAGCGGDDDDSDGSSEAPAVTETAPADDGGSVEAAAEACKDGVEKNPGQLSEAEIEQLCEDAANARYPSLEICKQVVKKKVPEGPGRDAALEAC